MSDDREAAIFKEIAVCSAAAIKVSGGSGSGKTFALTQRVLRLLKQEVDPEQIAVFVPTRIAAAAFMDGLQVSAPERGRLYVGTLRDFCLSLLTSPRAVADTGRVPRLLADFEYKILLEDLKTIGYKPRLIRNMLGYLLHSWTQLDDLREGFVITDDERLLLDKLRSTLIARKAMLNEEVSNITYRYLNRNADVRATCARAHIMIDDYQGLNKASQALCDLLSKQSLVACGCRDEYVQGCDAWPYPDGFEDFGQGKPEFQEFMLTTNLRCPLDIAACGNALIVASDMDLNALAIAAKDASRGVLRLVKWSTPLEEVEQIAQYLKQRLEDTADRLIAGDVFIAVPTAERGQTFARALAALGIKSTSILHPGVLHGDPRIFARCQNLLAYTLLNLLADDEDLVAWRNWCGFGDALSRSSLWLRLEGLASERHISELEALELLSELQEPPFAEADILLQRFADGKKIIAAHRGKRGYALLNAITPKGQDFPPDVLALIEPILGNETAKELYERTAEGLREPLFDDVERVRIGLWQTLPGLSVPMLIIPSLLNGLVPPATALDNTTAKGRQAGDELSRRAFYTTLTKAGCELILSYFHKMPLAEASDMVISRIRAEGKRQMAIVSPSVFLDDFGDALPPATSDLLGQTTTASLVFKDAPLS
jgi:DNA helicase-2/ATP-dependent DNA helicase PcrA